MKGTSLLLLSALLASALAGWWTKPTVVVRSLLPMLFQAQVTDPYQNQTHFLYSYQDGIIRQQLYFQSVIDDKVGSAIPIMKGYYHAGPSDIQLFEGKLYLALNVLRDESALEYRDVYFMESADKGKTWSAAVAVPREDMKDAFHRYSPMVVPNEANDRVCLVYFKAAKGQAEGDVCWACRAPGSKVFGNEVAIVKGVPVISRVRMAASVHNLRVTLHLLYVAKNENANALFYHKSTDNGLTWTRQKLSDYGTLEAYQEPALITGPSDYKDGRLVVGYSYRGNGDAAMYTSYDNGEKWSSSMLSGSSKYAITSLALCNIRMGLWTVFLGRSTDLSPQRVDNDGRHNYWVVDTSSTRELDNPFTTDNPLLTVYRPQFGCSYFPTTGSFVTASAIAYLKDSTYVLLYNRAKANPT